MVVFLITKTLENFLSYDLTGNGTRKQACRYALTEDAPVVDREEAYCYNGRNELTERKALSGITEYLYDEIGSLLREQGEKTVISTMPSAT